MYDRVSARLACVLLAIGLPAGGLWLRALQANPHKAPNTETQRHTRLGEAEAGSLYAITVAVKNPAQLQGDRQVHAEIADARGIVAEKWLHTADLDFYLTLRSRVRGAVTVDLSTRNAEPIPEIETMFHRIPMRSGEPSIIAAAPNDKWQDAQPFELGQTIFGADDERPYAPAPGEDRYAAMMKGFQWFRFTFHGNQPRLIYFAMDITDREVPLDVDIFQLGKNATGQPDVVPYTEGASIYQIEATQNYPGLYKFRTRILQPGETYYVRVDANHPAYQLRTYDYPVPPYRDPRQAVRTGWIFWSTWVTPGCRTRRVAGQWRCVPPWCTQIRSFASRATRRSLRHAAT